MTAPLRPTLVMMTYRGGPRLDRCLDSIEEAAHHFDRIILSVTAPEDSKDMRKCLEFQATRVPRAEVLCTQRELPTLEHQAMWVTHLEATGTKPSDWIYWLAYDDQVRLSGINAITDQDGNWPLKPRTAYFGPWAMRHEGAEEPFAGPWDAPLESWTSFPEAGPLRMPVMTWIGAQLIQPTYMQMSGSVCTFDNFIALRDLRPRKRGPMRIEMAIASGPGNDYVQEFSEPVSIIYGRPNSDRANYGKAARREDAHLALWLVRRSVRTGREARAVAGLAARVLRAYVGFALRRTLPAEEWRVRSRVTP